MGTKLRSLYISATAKLLKYKWLLLIAGVIITMGAKLRSLLLKYKWHPLIAGGVIVLLLAFALAIAVFGLDWTGFTSATGPTLKPNEQYRPAKTLWDVLQLLIVPIILAVGGFWLNQMQKQREQRDTEERAKIERETEEKRAQSEREIAADNQREVALQAYIDRMSELLLKERDRLRESQPEDEIRKVARVRTLTVLPRLDASRKRSVLQFLYESHLLDRDKMIIDLSGADFKGVTLAKANLSNANLGEVDLSEADLSQTFLMGVSLTKANLSGANLAKANLSGAILQEANLSHATLQEANLSHANLGKAILYRASFNSADLSSADLSNAQMIRANFAKANLSGAILQEAKLYGVILREAILKAADLSNATLGSGFLEAKFKGTRIALSKFFSEFDFSNFPLPLPLALGFTIVNVDLSGLQPIGANLMEDYAEADLSKADLSNANLNHTDLRGVILKKASLREAIVTSEQLKQAKSLEGATLPDGSTHP
jgi:uncharacterized protein YjbI with pentapeptide repeats